MSRPLRRIPDGALAAVVVAAVFALQLPFRLHAVNPTDEGAILQNGVEILSGRRMYVDVAHPAFPGVHYLMAAAFALGGTTFDTARTLMCVVFALMTGAIFRIGRWWLRPAGALALVVLFVDYRVWAYPHFHMVSYSSVAVALLVGAALLVGIAFETDRAITYAAAGAVASLAMVTKQDSGVIGAAALGLAIVLAAPAPLRRRLTAALQYTAGATAVFAAALAAVAWAGMLPDLVLHTIVAPLHGLQHFEYQGSPPLWPFAAQDAAVRERAYSYFPTILVDLFWPAVSGSTLYRETAFPDAALRLAYHLPWLVLVVAAPLVLPAAAPDDHTAVLRRARERLAFALAAACWLAFNRPHDWIHLLVLYPGTLLLLSVLIARAVAGRWQTAKAAAVGLLLATATVGSVPMALELRRTMATPVRSTRGVIYATRAQAASLQDLVDGLAAAAPPSVPVAPFPYHPLITFISGRPSFTRYYSIWPGEPDRGRAATVEHDLDARPDGLIVYGQSQVPYFRRMGSYAPELFGYLADHYRIAKVLGGQPLGYEFLLLEREAPPAGRPLLSADASEARVMIEPAQGPPREATAEERARLVGQALWPFRRVLRVGTEAGATVAVRIPVEPGPTTRVSTSYGVDPDLWTLLPPLRPRFEIAVAADGTETIVASGTRDPFANRDDRRWTDVDVDLAPWAGKAVELVLRVAGQPGAPGMADRTGFGEPRILP